MHYIKKLQVDIEVLLRGCMKYFVGSRASGPRHPRAVLRLPVPQTGFPHRTSPQLPPLLVL